MPSPKSPAASTIRQLLGAVDRGRRSIDLLTLRTARRCSGPASVPLANSYWASRRAPQARWSFTALRSNAQSLPDVFLMPLGTAPTLTTFELGA